MKRCMYQVLLCLALASSSMLCAQSASGSPESAGISSQQAVSSPDASGHRMRYQLRAGDSVVVEYRLTPEFNQTATIQPDGFVSLPLVGEAHLAGLTLAQAHALILERTGGHLKDPEVNVTLKEFERPYVVVAGEVPHPGRFDFYQKTTALQAILLAGGFSASAQQSQVYVFRRVEGDLAEVHALNLKGIKRSRNLERDLVLEQGDMILVPRNKLEIVGRFIKATNLSFYFDPLTYVPH